MFDNLNTSDFDLSPQPENDINKSPTELGREMRKNLKPYDDIRAAREAVDKRNQHQKDWAMVMGGIAKASYGVAHSLNSAKDFISNTLSDAAFNMQNSMVPSEEFKRRVTRRPEDEIKEGKNLDKKERDKRKKEFEDTRDTLLSLGSNKLFKKYWDNHSDNFVENFFKDKIKDAKAFEDEANTHGDNVRDKALRLISETATGAPWGIVNFMAGSAFSFAESAGEAMRGGKAPIEQLWEGFKSGAIRRLQGDVLEKINPLAQHGIKGKAAEATITGATFSAGDVMKSLLNFEKPNLMEAAKSWGIGTLMSIGRPMKPSEIGMSKIKEQTIKAYEKESKEVESKAKETFIKDKSIFPSYKNYRNLVDYFSVQKAMQDSMDGHHDYSSIINSEFDEMRMGVDPNEVLRKLGIVKDKTREPKKSMGILSSFSAEKHDSWSRWSKDFQKQSDAKIKVGNQLTDEVASLYYLGKLWSGKTAQGRAFHEVNANENKIPLDQTVHIIINPGEGISLRRDIDGYLVRQGTITKEKVFNDLFDSAVALSKEMPDDTPIYVPEYRYRGTLLDFTGGKGQFAKAIFRSQDKGYDWGTEEQADKMEEIYKQAEKPIEDKRGTTYRKDYGYFGLGIKPDLYTEDLIKQWVEKEKPVGVSIKTAIDNYDKTGLLPWEKVPNYATFGSGLDPRGTFKQRFPRQDAINRFRREMAEHFKEPSVKYPVEEDKTYSPEFMRRDNEERLKGLLRNRPSTTVMPGQLAADPNIQLRPGTTYQISTRGDDGLWSIPITADLVSDMGGSAVFNVGGVPYAFNKGLVSIYKTIGQHTRSQLQEKSASLKDVKNNPKTLFISVKDPTKGIQEKNLIRLPLLRRVPKTVGKSVFWENKPVTDNTVLQNQSLIGEAFANAKRMIMGYSVPEDIRTVTTFKMDNLLFDFGSEEKREAFVELPSGIDIGDRIRIRDTSGRSRLVEIVWTKTHTEQPDQETQTYPLTKEPKSLVYEKQPYEKQEEKVYFDKKTGKPSKPKSSYRVKIVKPEEPVGPFEDINIFKGLGSGTVSNIKASAPQTYAYLVSQMYELRNFMDNVKVNRNKPVPDSIILKSSGELTFEKQEGFSKTNQVVAHPEKIYGVDNNGKTLYETEYGLVDEDGYRHWERGRELDVHPVLLNREWLPNNHVSYESGKKEIDAILDRTQTAMITSSDVSEKYRVGQVIEIQGGKRMIDYTPEKNKIRIKELYEELRNTPKEDEDKRNTLKRRIRALRRFEPSEQPVPTAQVLITKIKRGVEGKLDMQKETSMTGRESWVAQNKKLAEEMRKGLGLNLKDPNRSGKPWLDPIGDMFSPNSKDKRRLFTGPQDYIEFQLITKPEHSVLNPYQPYLPGMRPGFQTTIKDDPRKAEDFKYSEPLSDADKSLSDIYDKLKSLAVRELKGEDVKKFKSALWNQYSGSETYAGMDSLYSMAREDVMVDPSSMTLRDYLYKNDVVPFHTYEHSLGKRGISAPEEIKAMKEVEAQWGLDIDLRGRPGTIHPDVIPGSTYEHIGEAITRVVPSSREPGAYWETVVTGQDLGSYKYNHYRSKREMYAKEFQKKLANPDKPTKLDSVEFAIDSMDHIDLMREFGGQSKWKLEYSKAIEEEIQRTSKNFVDVESIVGVSGGYPGEGQKRGAMTSGYFDRQASKKFDMDTSQEAQQYGVDKAEEIMSGKPEDGEPGVVEVLEDIDKAFNQDRKKTAADTSLGEGELGLGINPFKYLNKYRIDEFFDQFKKPEETIYDPDYQKLREIHDKINISYMKIRRESTRLGMKPEDYLTELLVKKGFPRSNTDEGAIAIAKGNPTADSIARDYIFNRFNRRAADLDDEIMHDILLDDKVNRSESYEMFGGDKKLPEGYSTIPTPHGKMKTVGKKLEPTAERKYVTTKWDRMKQEYNYQKDKILKHLNDEMVKINKFAQDLGYYRNTSRNFQMSLWEHQSLAQNLPQYRQRLSYEIFGELGREDRALAVKYAELLDSMHRATQWVNTRDESGAFMQKMPTGKSSGKTFKELSDEFVNLQNTIENNPEKDNILASFVALNHEINILTHRLVMNDEIGWHESWEGYVPYIVKEYQSDTGYKARYGIRPKGYEAGKKYLERPEWTNMERVLDPDILLDFMVNVRHDHIWDHFVHDALSHEDLFKRLTDKQKTKLGIEVDKYGSHGQIVHVDKPIHVNGYGTLPAGKYRWYTPYHFKFKTEWVPSKTERMDVEYIDINPETGEPYKYPLTFKRNVITGYEGGYTKIVGNKPGYLVPENIWKGMDTITAPTGKAVWYMNRANAWGKKYAILSTYSSFLFNNAIGDLQTAIGMHPARMKFAQYFIPSFELARKMYSNDVGKKVQFTEREQHLKDWMEQEGITGATQLRAELEFKTGGKGIANHMMAIANARESWMRIANAMYVHDMMESGRGEDLLKQFSFVSEVERGRTLQEKANIIARSYMCDYSSQGPLYKKIVTGLVFPFGKWYFTMSNMARKFIFKGDTMAEKVGWGSAKLAGGIGMMALINAWNSSQDDGDIERSLNEDIRSKFHIIFGRNERGQARVWSPQLPQDVLVGTKIFSVAGDYVNRARTGEMSITDAAKGTLKAWGIQERKGIFSMLNPGIKFLTGLYRGRDPVTGVPIYPTYRITDMSGSEQLWYAGLYGQQCFVPAVGAMFSEMGVGSKTFWNALDDVTLKRVMSLKALGFREYDAQVGVDVPTSSGGTRNVGKNLLDKLREKQHGEEEPILRNIETNWVKSKMSYPQYVKTEEYAKEVNKLKSLYGPHWPEVAGSLASRLTHIFKNPHHNIKIIDNILGERDTIRKLTGQKYLSEEDRRMLIQQRRIWIKKAMEEQYKHLPKSVRSLTPDVVKELSGKE